MKEAVQKESNSAQAASETYNFVLDLKISWQTGSPSMEAETLSQRPQTELRSTAPREPPFTANSRLSRPAAARFLPDAVNLGPDSRSLLHNPHAGPWVSFGFAPKIQPRPLLFSSPMNPHETKMLQTPDWYYCILAFSSFEAGKSLAHWDLPQFFSHPRCPRYLLLPQQF